MEFSFLRISGEDFENHLRAYAPNGIVGAYLSRVGGDSYAVMCGAEIVGALKTADGVLSAFFADERAASRAFAATLKRFRIRGASVLTADSRFLSLCLGMSNNVETQSCVYEFTSPRTYPYVALRHALSPRDLTAALLPAELTEDALKDLISRRAVYVGDDCFCVADMREHYNAAFVSAFASDENIASALLCRMAMLCRDYNLLALSLSPEQQSPPLEIAGFACTQRIARINFV